MQRRLKSQCTVCVTDLTPCGHTKSIAHTAVVNRSCVVMHNSMCAKLMPESFQCTLRIFFETLNITRVTQMQVEGLRNEYNRVTSGTNSKTSSNPGQSSTDEVSQLKQEAQALQVGVPQTATPTIVQFDEIMPCQISQKQHAYCYRGTVTLQAFTISDIVITCNSHQSMS